MAIKSQAWHAPREGRHASKLRLPPPRALAERGSCDMNASFMLLPALSAVLLTGCTADGVRHGVYDALVNQHCVERPGRSGCGNDPRPYDDYVRERERWLKLHAAMAVRGWIEPDCVE